jgi:nicotinate-nucleotide adenylyltransferase
MKLGIFGGTFNPPHIGHLIVAEHVRSVLSLDKIIFIPSYISPHKQEGEEKSSLHRLEMVKLAVQGNDAFAVSNIEIETEEISYTLHTLEYLKNENPADELFLLIGMDNYLTFHLWKEPKKVLELATLVVMNRPNYPKRVNEIIGTENTLFVDVPNIDIASSDLRRRIAVGESVKYSIPEKVLSYIVDNSLYRR